MSEHPPEKACCAPSNPGGDEPKKAKNWTAGRLMPTETKSGSSEGMVYLPGGEFLMGTDDEAGFPADGEGPIRAVTLAPFWIDEVALSNTRFVEFIEATGHVTEAEHYGW